MLQVKEQDGIKYGSLAETNRLNATVAAEVKADLTAALSSQGAKMILNLSNISFIDSTGIGTLISALKTARQNGGTFQLCCIKAEVLSLLKLMKLDKVFDIFDSEEQIA
ncbi:STAS domain-containing protein [Carboxylicivirga sp. A043]|uniref:STAS domain-containing protein n=1 Tax=Carboxylicivirga litoralis TaxID=2816963 RepID=UPI0021CB16D5|nr:STAS domain-containing protein [Carboxylicivirga sp. A043]MCU4157373.1 STAS domain-containing protein [Carboxylicivirga sp. A043]